MKKSTKVIKFIIKLFKYFFIETKESFISIIEWIRKPSNWSQLIILAALIAVLLQKLSLTVLFIIMVLLYGRMHWIDGTIRKEIKDEELKKLKEKKSS